MKILFKQKHWIVMQIIFSILGILAGLMVKSEGATGGVGVALHFFLDPDLILPILFILYSDLLLNVEYIQGTFLTYLICGRGRVSWTLKKFANFYLFILIQLAITFGVLWLSSSIVLGHFGTEGIKNAVGTLKDLKTEEVIRNFGLSVLKIYMFVSFGVFISSLIPGKIAIGSFASIGLLFLIMSGLRGLYQVHRDSKILGFIIHNIFFDNPTKYSWLVGLLIVALFTYLTVERIKRLEISSRGA